MPIFNAPPGWPVPPAGWTPPEGWQPDPSWPAPPADHVWWVEEPAAEPSWASLERAALEGTAPPAVRAAQGAPAGSTSVLTAPPAAAAPALPGVTFTPGGSPAAPLAPAPAPLMAAPMPLPTAQRGPAFGAAPVPAYVPRSVELIAGEQRREGRRSMIVGALLLLLGLGVTLGSLLLSDARGGPALLFWGPVVFGGIQLVRGVVTYVRADAVALRTAVG